MQIVIDIPEDDYRKVQDGRASVSMMRKAIANGTPLHKCDTNGDVIKALFPNDSRGFLIVNMDRNDWWNAPYKTESE